MWRIHYVSPDSVNTKLSNITLTFRSFIMFEIVDHLRTVLQILSPSASLDITIDPKSMKSFVRPPCYICVLQKKEVAITWAARCLEIYHHTSIQIPTSQVHLSSMLFLTTVWQLGLSHFHNAHWDARLNRSTGSNLEIREHTDPHAERNNLVTPLFSLIKVG
jgi:hypothetical protein